MTFRLYSVPLCLLNHFNTIQNMKTNRDAWRPLTIIRCTEIKANRDGQRPLKHRTQFSYTSWDIGIYYARVFGPLTCLTTMVRSPWAPPSPAAPPPPDDCCEGADGRNVAVSARTDTPHQRCRQAPLSTIYNHPSPQTANDTIAPTDTKMMQLHWHIPMIQSH